MRNVWCDSIENLLHCSCVCVRTTLCIPYSNICLSEQLNTISYCECVCARAYVFVLASQRIDSEQIPFCLSANVLAMICLITIFFPLFISLVSLSSIHFYRTILAAFRLCPHISTHTISACSQSLPLLLCCSVPAGEHDKSEAKTFKNYKQARYVYMCFMIYYFKRKIPNWINISPGLDLSIPVENGIGFKGCFSPLLSFSRVPLREKYFLQPSLHYTRAAVYFNVVRLLYCQEANIISVKWHWTRMREGCRERMKRLSVVCTILKSRYEIYAVHCILEYGDKKTNSTRIS